MLCRAVHWRHVDQNALAAAYDVPGLDPRERRQARFGLGLPALAVDQFALAAGEESLGHRLVVGITHAADRRGALLLPAALAEGDAGVLAALVAVVGHDIGLAS